MKILLLTPSIRPLGARRSLVELVRALPAGFTPLVVVPAMDGIALELKDLGVDLVVAPQGAWRKLGGRLTAVFFQVPKIRRAIRSFAPDVCHANEFHVVPQLLSAKIGNLGISGHIRLGITPRQIQTYNLKGLDRIVTVSKAVASLLDGTGLEDRVRVVYNGVDLGNCLPAAPGGKSGSSVETGIRVGLLGLVSDRKNQLVAAEAVALVGRRGIPAHLVVAGDAFGSSEEYGRRLRARLAEPDLVGRSTWLPFQSDVASVYRELDLNLLISKEEGFGRTIVEAGALGIPSIGTRIGGIPELIDDGRTGWLVNEGDVEGLADAIEHAARDQAERLRRGEAARQRVINEFTIQAHVSHMIRVWEEAIEKASRRST